jgi:hypothetical protein
MKRKVSGLKHKDTDAAYEKTMNNPDPMKRPIGGSGRGAKGHSHPHPGMVGSTKGTWNSQTDYVSSGNRWDKDIPGTPNPRKKKS